MSVAAELLNRTRRLGLYRRNLLPSRSGWLHLLVTPSSYLLVAAFLATAVAKVMLLGGLEGLDSAGYVLVWALLLDLFVYLGLAAALSMIEAPWPRLRHANLAIAGVVTAFAAANVAYLVIAGDQATWGALVQLLRRIDDAWNVVREGMSPAIVGAMVLGGTLLVALPLSLRRLTPSKEHREGALSRARSAGWLAAVGGLAALVLPSPSSLHARDLGRNGLVSLLSTMGNASQPGTFAGYGSVPMETEQEQPQTKRYNVVLLILESTRYDYTSLAKRPHERAGDTPHLVELAKRGAVFHNARTVLPHTTKALFSILCGRLPLLQKELVELSAHIQADCAPSMLGRLGYHTAFFQSAFGTFEERPRLAHLFGFDTFKAWEDIRGRRLGYLASDDESLAKPFRNWLDNISQSGNPFFATFLTSSPHHPYRLTKKSKRRAKKQGKPAGGTQDRYARLIESEDVLLGEILDTLKFQSLEHETIVVVLGDHGEGFGDHGVRQHDNNFYEEGIKVPLVFAGPGVPNEEFEQNVSLVDVTPTLLDLLDFPLNLQRNASFAGIPLFSKPIPEDRPRLFTCWFSERCRGFVIGDKKVVEEPDAGEIWYFDLARDPDENDPQQPLTPALEKFLAEYREAFAAHTTDGSTKIEHGLVDEYEPWICPKGKGKCFHPRAKARHHRPPKKQAETDGKKLELEIEGKAPQDPPARKARRKSKGKSDKSGKRAGAGSD